MKRTILVLSVLLTLAGTAPASAAFLGANPRLGESLLNTGIEQVAGDVSREGLPGSSGAWLRRASEFFVAPANAPRFGTWNEFQAGTAGQFSSRAEAAQAWQVYKDANGIVTGTVRSPAARAQYLRSLADDYRTPSWMKPWLEEGRCPPGYDVDHINPLSIGGSDTPANMRLQGTDLHRLWHKRYHPWTD